MRMSCNGCRVLRKGCSENCSIRPCLQWIKNPESQANATVFLAKFYGRAGLMNLINGGPDHIRPAIFRSLLYEACGRIVNPIYGSVGLLWSGSWQLCQAAVEAVLKGAPIMQIATEAAANAPVPLLNKASSYDIRHISKDEAVTAATVAAHIRGFGAVPADAPGDLNKVNKASRPRFKRPGNHHGSGAAADSAQAATRTDTHDAEPAAERDSNIPWRPSYHLETSDDEAASQASRPEGVAAGEANAGANTREGESRENGSMFSADTPEGSMVTSHGPGEAGKAEDRAADDGEVELELTLGFEPVHHHHHHPHHYSPHRSSSSSNSHSPAHSPSARSAPRPACRSTGEICSVDLALDLAA